MKKVVQFLINLFFSVFPINENKILFEYGRKNVDDNPLALYEYFKKNKMDKEYRLIFIVDNGVSIDLLDKNDVFYYKTFLYLYHKATAKYWIRSQSIGSILKKKRGQIYLYVDHGSFGLKKCGYDIGNDKKRPRKEFTYEWDWYISANDYSIKTIRRSTGYDGKCVSLGLARTDKLVNIDYDRVEKIKKKLGIDKNKKPIVLYAPTFREKDIETEIPSYKIEKIMKCKDICFILTVHPLAKKVMRKIKIPNNVIDAIDYDVNDLLLIFDILVTDYSSVFFDYLILNRPIIFYPYDFYDYSKEKNGFYIDYEKEVPGPIAYSEDDVIKYLLDKKLLSTYDNKREALRIEINKENDGNVCEKITNKIIKKEF